MAVATTPFVEPDLLELIEGQRAQFEEDGLLVIRNAVPLETIERVTAAADAIVAEGGSVGRWMGKPASMLRRVEYRGLTTLSEAFLELLTPPTVFPLIVRLLSPNIHLMSSQLLYANANQEPKPDQGGWHRDVIGSSEDLGYDATPRLAIRVGFYVSDVTQPDTGITLFVPGSHRLRETLPLKPGSRDPETYTRLHLELGDVVMWENRTFHAPEINTSPHTRKLLTTQYGYRWLRPVDYITHSPDLLHGCDPVTRQLLASDDFNEDGSMTRMKGSQALTDWAMEHGLV